MADPVANPDYYTIAEDALLNQGGGSYGLLANDTDPDDQPLHTDTAYGTTSHGGTYSIGSDGSFQYTPASGFTGRDTFDYTARDPNENADTGLATIYVKPSDYHDPTITAPLSIIVPHGAAKSVAFSLDTTDTSDDQPIHVSLFVGSGALAVGSHAGVSVSGDGTNHVPMTLDGTESDVNAALQNLSFTAGEPGQNAYLEIYVDDAYHGDESSSGESREVVQLRDKQPTDVVEGTGNVDMAHAQSLDADFHLFDDPDVDGDEPVGGNPHATVLGEGKDALDWFSFTVASDGTIILDIDYGNAAFQRQGDGGVEYSPTSFDTVLTLYDANGTFIQSYDDSDGSDNGSSSPTDSYATVDLTAGTYYVSVDIFSDGDDSDDDTSAPLDGIPSGLTYQLNITAPHVINTPPDAVDDSASIAELRTSVTVPQVATGSILTNDTDANSSDVLSVLAVAGDTAKVGVAVVGDFGTLVVDSDGTYTYSVLNTDKLIKGETGHDAFTYTASDGHGGTDTATLSFTITGDDLDVFADGTFVAHRGDDRIKGGDAADDFAGRDGNDILLGHGKADSLFGEAGDDKLFGGSGDDHGIGGAGADAISLGSGDDTGWGDSGNDTVSGDDGQDKLFGGSGDDTLDGGANGDRIQGQDGDDDLTGGGGADRMWGGIGNDAMHGNGGADQMAGGDGVDTEFGGNGDDRMWGDAGNDNLVGGAGSDQMVGGAGKDKLFLDEGDDTAWGGKGADQFIFTDGFGNDTVKDFHGNDTIVFAGPFSSWDEVKSHLTQQGDNAVIDDGHGNTVTVEHVKPLGENDFLFA